MKGTLAGVPQAELEELVEDLSDLHHDLGKYMRFETRFVGEDAPFEARQAAVRKDLHQTHRHRGSVESCWQVWARLRPEALVAEPEVNGIDAALAELEGLSLEDEEGVEAAVALAGQVGSLTRKLLDRARALQDGEDDWGL